MDIYGINTCDTCRKARKWLDEAGVNYHWHDLRETPPGEAAVRRWIKQTGVEKLINRRSTTWRNLDEKQRSRADSDEGAVGLLQDHPTLIKRPVIEAGTVVLIGFTDQTGTTLLELP